MFHWPSMQINTIFYKTLYILCALTLVACSTSQVTNAPSQAASQTASQTVGQVAGPRAGQAAGQVAGQVVENKPNSNNELFAEPDILQAAVVQSSAIKD